MPDLNRQAAFLADTNGFVDCLPYGVAFVAHVCGVNATKLRGFPRQGDQLFGLGIRGGCAFKRCRHAHGTIVHGMVDELLHGCELLSVWLTIVITQNRAAHLRGAHVAAEVDANSLLLQACEIFLESTPVGSEVVMVVLVTVCRDDGVVQGSG